MLRGEIVESTGRDIELLQSHFEGLRSRRAYSYAPYGARNPIAA
jgi:hypothetical protein